MGAHRSKWSGFLGGLQGRHLHSSRRQAEAADFLARGLVDLASDAVVVDLGAGSGVLSLPLAQRLSTGHVHAVDVSAEMLAHLERRCRGEGLQDRVRIHRRSADDTGLPAASADLVVSSALLHEVPHPSTVLDEAWRVAKPGARLMLRDFVNHRYSWVSKLIHPSSAHGHLLRSELEGMVRVAGFVKLEISRAGRHVDVFAFKPV